MVDKSIEFYIPLAARIYRIVYHSLLMFDTIAKIGKLRQCNCKLMVTIKVHCEDGRYSDIVAESTTIETKYLVISHLKQGKI